MLWMCIVHCAFIAVSNDGNIQQLYWEHSINIIFQILDEIHEAINDPNALSDSIIRDLYHLKFELRLMLSNHVDQLSFKVLSNIERDMEWVIFRFITRIVMSDIG